MDPSHAISPLPRRHDGVGKPSRRTGATARRQVDDKVILGEALPVGAAWHPGYQLAARIGEGLAGPAVAIGGVAHGLLHRHTGVGLALLHQLQRPQVVRSVARHTSTAVISWVPVSTTMAALCPSKRLLLLLCPWRISGSCTDIPGGNPTCPSINLHTYPCQGFPPPLARRSRRS